MSAVAETPPKCIYYVCFYTWNFVFKGDTLSQRRCTKAVQPF